MIIWHIKQLFFNLDKSCKTITITTYYAYYSLKEGVREDGLQCQWLYFPLQRNTKQPVFFLFFIFCNLNVEKSQILSLPMDQNANLAESHLCPVPTRKSCQDSCCRGRQIHKSGFPFSLLPFPCGAWHYFSGSLLLYVESQETFLCSTSMLIYLTGHLVPLGSSGLLGRSFMRNGIPWSIRSFFLGWIGAQFSLLPILLCTG